MAKLGQVMQGSDFEKGLALVDEAIKENASDEEYLVFLNQIRLQVQMFPATQLSMKGKYDEAIALLEKLKKENPDRAADISEVELRVMLQSDKFDQATVRLTQLATAEKPDALQLNAFSWAIYERAVQDKELPKNLIEAATVAAKRAAEVAPTEAAVLDTYAHLLHYAGKLEAAIEVQSKAVKFPSESAEEIKAFYEQLKKEKAAAESGTTAKSGT
jgi:tetratricopeptide (TPR) repeat protein